MVAIVYSLIHSLKHFLFCSYMLHAKYYDQIVCKYYARILKMKKTLNSKSLYPKQSHINREYVLNATVEMCKGYCKNTKDENL